MGVRGGCGGTRVSDGNQPTVRLVLSENNYKTKVNYTITMTLEHSALPKQQLSTEESTVLFLIHSAVANDLLAYRGRRHTARNVLSVFGYAYFSTVCLSSHVSSFACRFFVKLGNF